MGQSMNQIKALLPYRLKHRIRLGRKQLLARLERNTTTRMLVNEFRLRVHKTTPIIIFQMGKVGFSSVYQPLKNMGLFVFHQHTLRPESIRRSMEKIGPGNPGYQDYLQTALWLSNQIIIPGLPVKIITMTRAPIARAVSAFFETLERKSGIENAHQEFSMDELLEQFSQRLSESSLWLNWYEWEFKEVTGVNVYDYPFDPVKGYGRIQERNYDVLLLRLETPDEVKEKTIAEFLDLPNFKMGQANVAENKDYADVYQEFKQRLQIPTDILDMNYNAKHTRHFYTAEEIARFRARWDHSD